VTVWLYGQRDVVLTRMVMECGCARLYSVIDCPNRQCWSSPMKMRLVAYLTRQSTILDFKADVGTIIQQRESRVEEKETMQIPSTISCLLINSRSYNQVIGFSAIGRIMHSCQEV
jgi:hypothetical protein